MENSPSEEDKHVRFMKRCRTYFGKKTDDEDSFLLLLMDSYSNDQEMLRYFGLEEQTKFPHGAWKKIKAAMIKRQDTVVSKDVAPPNTVKHGKLSEYFKTFKNEPQKWEYEIIKEYFDIKKDKYLSIPLINRGVLHIVYKEKVEDTFAPKRHNQIATHLQNDY